jgi:hypothetical protein
LATGVAIERTYHTTGTAQFYYMECSAYSNLKQSSNNVQENDLYTLPNTTIWEVKKDLPYHEVIPRIDDHYMIITCSTEENMNETIMIFAHGCKEMRKMIDTSQEKQ